MYKMQQRKEEYLCIASNSEYNCSAAFSWILENYYAVIFVGEQDCSTWFFDNTVISQECPHFKVQILSKKKVLNILFLFFFFFFGKMAYIWTLENICTIWLKSFSQGRAQRTFHRLGQPPSRKFHRHGQFTELCKYQ